MPAPEEVGVVAPVWDVLEVAVVAAIAHLVAVDPGMLEWNPGNLVNHLFRFLPSYFYYFSIMHMLGALTVMSLGCPF